MQRLQNKVVRLTLGETGHDLPTEELLRQIKVLSVHQLSTYNSGTTQNSDLWQT